MHVESLIMLSSSTFCQKYKLSIAGQIRCHQHKACVNCQVAPSYFDAPGVLSAHSDVGSPEYVQGHHTRVAFAAVDVSGYQVIVLDITLCHAHHVPLHQSTRLHAMDIYVYA